VQFTRLAFASGAKQAAEKLQMESEIFKIFPRGLKAGFIFEAFTARLKPCPFTKQYEIEFFAACKTRCYLESFRTG
jgi:hypothetical protein